MKSAKKYHMVLVTAPDAKTARSLAKTALEARLIACANIVPKIESHYRWQGKIVSSTEVLLMMKTTRRQLVKLETLILAGHPYDTPEFVTLPFSEGSEGYLRWIKENVRA
jgi:periplasmic divalent cation tolerance protein